MKKTKLNKSFKMTKAVVFRGIICLFVLGCSFLRRCYESHPTPIKPSQPRSIPTSLSPHPHTPPWRRRDRGFWRPPLDPLTPAPPHSWDFEDSRSKTKPGWVVVSTCVRACTFFFVLFIGIHFYSDNLCSCFVTPLIDVNWKIKGKFNSENSDFFKNLLSFE